MKKRAIIGAMVLPLLAVMLLAGCDSGNNASGGKVTLSFWSRDSDAALVQPLVTAYNASHTNQIKLTLVPATLFVTKFASAVAGGSVPDVVATDLVYAPAFGAQNELTDISSQAQGLSFFNKLSPSHVRLGTYQGKIYALPFSAEGSFLLYNKDLFTKAGLDPNKGPASWADVENDAKAITKLGNGNYGYHISGANGGINAFTFLPYIWASGGDALSQDGSQPTLASSPQVKDALNFYRRLWTEGVVDPGSKVDDGSNWFTGFAAGKIGIVGAGAFELSTLKTKNSNINFGVAPIPGETSGTSSFAGGDDIAIPRGSKHVKEAFDFIQWCLQDDQQVGIFAKNGGLPVRTDLASNQYSQQDPRYITVSNAFANGRTVYSTHTDQLFNDANSPWLKMLQDAVFNGNIDGSINTAQSSFQQILASK
jgi:multiple sugar transport system substrate-binding protein